MNCEVASTLPSTLDSSPRRVLVVDDHAVVRTSLVALVNSDSMSFVCVGAPRCTADILQMTSDTQPHIVLLDADLAGEDGIALIPSLRARAPCSVVVLSSQLDEALTIYATRLGAVACIHKLAPADELMHALALVSLQVATAH